MRKPYCWYTTWCKIQKRQARTELKTSSSWLATKVLEGAFHASVGEKASITLKSHQGDCRFEFTGAVMWFMVVLLWWAVCQIQNDKFKWLLKSDWYWNMRKRSLLCKRWLQAHWGVWRKDARNGWHWCCEKKCVWILNKTGNELKWKLIGTFPRKRGSDVGGSQSLLRMFVVECERIRWTIFSVVWKWVCSSTVIIHNSKWAWTDHFPSYGFLN